MFEAEREDLIARANSFKAWQIQCIEELYHYETGQAKQAYEVVLPVYA